MSKIVTIPDCMSPFSVTVNNKTYEYNSGDQIEVPDEVAEIIKMHMDAHEAATAPPAPPVSGGGCGSGIKVQPLTVTENGSYLAPSGVAYSPVKVNVASGGGGDNSLEQLVNGTLEEANLPNATSIKQYSFYGCNTLKRVNMPKVTYLTTNAFYGCSNLELTSLPSGLTGIATKVFYKCSKLALTSLPSGVSSIGSSAFEGCTNLALTSLPSGISRIDAAAFKDCTALTTITFEGKPASLSNSAFNGCTNLTTINVPWAEGAVSGAPWGSNATINYNYTGD